ncbi:MAG TPA: hypothetical protein H9955_18480 [Candidatus Mediterraneibacter cottocaccae]|nr:hypothetical protein [Candidatus Mediterraneibacter cottocaccae]
MVRFAKFILTAGIFIILVSVILLGYLDNSNAGYWVNVLNIIWGGVMIFIAALYLRVTLNKQRKEEEKK